MAFDKTNKAEGPARKRVGGGMRRRKKVCVFCGKDNVIDYKDMLSGSCRLQGLSSPCLL